jgi:hypothetical protein
VHYEPTSHEYLYEMPREQVFALFIGALAGLKVDDDGVHCMSAEAQALSRLARAVQTRCDYSPREDKLHGLATVSRVLLSRTDDRDRGEPPSFYEMPMPALVDHFLQLRSEVGDFLPGVSPDAVPADLAPELLDEELPYDHPAVQALIAADPSLGPQLREAYDFPGDYDDSPVAVLPKPKRKPRRPWWNSRGTKRKRK